MDAPWQNALEMEKLSGMFFEDYLRENVFAPLGMPHANVSLAGEKPGTYSSGYIWRDSRFQRVPHQPQYNPGYGSLNASALDMANVLQAYLRDWETPKGQFLSKAALNDSETPHTYLSAKSGFKNSYAYGNESREIEGRVFRGHAGSIAGYGSNFLYSRELCLGFAFSINTHNPDFQRFAADLVVRFLTRHLEQPQTPSAFPLDSAAVSPFLGHYRLSNSSDLYMIYFQGLQNTFKLEQHQHELRAGFLLGGSMTWKAADSSSLLFTNEWAKDPRILFLRDNENSPVIVEDTLYFEKISSFEAWAPLVFLLLSLLFMISSLVFGVVSSVRLLLKRQRSLHAFLLGLSPALATLGLLLSLWATTEFIEYIEAGKSISNLSVFWTFGRYSFALFVLTSVILLGQNWRKLQSSWLKGYLTVVALCGSYLLTVLLISNWF